MHQSDISRYIIILCLYTRTYIDLNTIYLYYDIVSFYRLLIFKYISTYANEFYSKQIQSLTKIKLKNLTGRVYCSHYLMVITRGKRGRLTIPIRVISNKYNIMCIVQEYSKNHRTQS